MPLTEQELQEELQIVKQEGLRIDQAVNATREIFKDDRDVYVFYELPFMPEECLNGNTDYDKNLITMIHENLKAEGELTRFSCVFYGITINGTPHLISIILDSEKERLIVNDSDPTFDISISTESGKELKEEIAEIFGYQTDQVVNGFIHRTLQFQMDDWECGIHAVLNSCEVIKKSKDGTIEEECEEQKLLEDDELDSETKRIITLAANFTEQAIPVTSPQGASLGKQSAEERER